MRLIDADALLTNMDKGMQGTAREYLKFYQMAVNDEPTAYDVDKVVEQLEQQKNQYFRRAEEIKNGFGENSESEKNYGKACSYDNAIKIVKSGGIE